MDLLLAGKGALVSGSSIGIGETIARVLADEGVAVAIHGRDADRAQRVATSIAEQGGYAVVVTGDLTDEAATRRIVADSERLLGGVDILINNAGGSGEKHVWEETPVEAWISAFDRNVVAAVRLTNLLLPKMRTAGWGRIVNISSLAGSLPPATGPDYSACKAAMNNLTKSLSKAAAGDGITVNAISPGTILTPKLEAAFRAMAADKGWAAADAPWGEIERAVLPHVFDVPTGRVGLPEDIARAVAFLCSPHAGYITGVDLPIDGGAMPAL
ncbi:SDR family NAD(P)-dependent oxidoreductase [Sphingomonas bacterium]|uniref:SDR family NAD(P)-dependent oxidoreductase n=1 Tax=Sphingomonas bacterium TaxID=1895847 RepID=UPI0015767FC6|nr:SDR family NAD(P)-dependent oxidoreductase [Sphingomonas bacterium]